MASYQGAEIARARAARKLGRAARHLIVAFDRRCASPSCSKHSEGHQPPVPRTNVANGVNEWPRGEKKNGTLKARLGRVAPEGPLARKLRVTAPALAHQLCDSALAGLERQRRGPVPSPRKTNGHW